MYHSSHNRRYFVSVVKYITILFQYMYRPSFIILYYDQQMHNYLTNYHTPTCFDIIVSSSGNM